MMEISQQKLKFGRKTLTNLSPTQIRELIGKHTDPLDYKSVNGLKEIFSFHTYSIHYIILFKTNFRFFIKILALNKKLILEKITFI